MNTLNLELYLEDDISEALSKCQFKEAMLVNFAGQEWEVKIEGASMISEQCTGDNFYRFTQSSKSYSVTGTVSNKSAKLLRHAKAEVRKKQQEFKEAQRKLSELMGEK